MNEKGRGRKRRMKAGREEDKRRRKVGDKEKKRRGRWKKRKKERRMKQKNESRAAKEKEERRKRERKHGRCSTRKGWMKGHAWRKVTDYVSGEIPGESVGTREWTTRKRFSVVGWFS